MVVCSNQPTLQQENEHIIQAFVVYNFPPGPLTDYKSNLTTDTTGTNHMQSTTVNATTPTTLVPATKIFPW